ncbi:SDR family NAD(P)-dependent oxidoreductase [Marinicauda algicola]|uniref:SDR family NAD(P)-dependent oxidoreductase n=1 Tax=Marinicauda algicola TaxID=2029849 RepID=A0A4S2H2B7_9PROT|nr:SDR family NAD(P)-dependent oxidoreductase [Marinicauda algicola]TGY89666.1 SDR family NAD(P)-dependent oxidoreductase [Marinicauda algicola]
MTEKKAAIIIGAGPGLGASLCRGFAKDGYAVCAVRRTKEKLEPLVAEIEAGDGEAHAFGADAADEAAVEDLFTRVEQEVGPVDLVVFNANGFRKKSVLETTAQDFRSTWENAAFAGFLAGRAAARRMIERERGTILYTGATASTRGGSGFAAFASAKFALKATAQALARELGPKGIHVAHVVVDGVIATPATREWIDDAETKEDEDELLDTDAIAQAYRHLARQHRSAWTFELDLRPWTEEW